MWHLLSLDAPTVAAVWVVFVGRSVGVRLPWVEPAAMFVAVWMIYAADRLLDARVLDAGGGKGDGLEDRIGFITRTAMDFWQGLGRRHWDCCICCTGSMRGRCICMRY